MAVGGRHAGQQPAQDQPAEQQLLADGRGEGEQEQAGARPRGSLGEQQLAELPPGTPWAAAAPTGRPGWPPPSRPAPISTAPSQAGAGAAVQADRRPATRRVSQRVTAPPARTVPAHCEISRPLTRRPPLQRHEHEVQRQEADGEQRHRLARRMGGIAGGQPRPARGAGLRPAGSVGRPPPGTVPTRRSAPPRPAPPGPRPGSSPAPARWPRARPCPGRCPGPAG